MEEEQQESDKSQRLHRILSVVVYAIWVTLVMRHSGIHHAARMAVCFLVPVACIWFPRPLGNHQVGYSPDAEQQPQPLFLRWVGWFLLLVVPVAILIMNAIKHRG